ncbi:TIGR03013 family XrtA/PEP-CTERM system glycosyltransferase [Rhodoferax fermentans]|uniref:Exopolysaccharide biosynthesis polyprenyl glycosylphosphotransferase n=1 Tax=Rhodoferax fermentans TaxID=28066 RepID=A0A1T1AT25_RHOFE|nr:TIGR03013 family XrtA/PEP-CTERM system glycosyltransferase [Rhodoferax fermentans]MBK1682289.1 sugar transferase [Rhodoferax fermentans]OOV07259.1 exopolysaccharide biosynthesis polyprenyl glycosylphosphotransferase [Rhodoferax fermentans]
MIKIFNHYFHKRTLFQIALDLMLLLLIALITSTAHESQHSVLGSKAAMTFLVLTGAMMVLNASLGFYQRVHNRSLGQTSARAVLALLCMAPVILGLATLYFDTRSFAMTLLSAIALMLLLRVYVMHFTPRNLMRQRVLVFGTGSRARLVGTALLKSDPTVDLVGYYAGPNEQEAMVSAWGLLSMSNSLTDIVKDQQVDEIVVALSERRGGSMPLRELLDCKLQGVKVVDIATHFERTLGQIRLESLSAGWLIFGDGFGTGWFRAFIKRVFDIVCASILIVLALPVMLITALLIVLEDGFPILYFQERVGQNGRLFNVVKFRSMRTDAEKDGKPRWAAAKDDRVTRVGRVIRKLRIDELPQLFSVLAGAMSMVGPRPERPFFVDKLTQEIPYYAIRHSVKPGVTGWAQVRYQYGSSVEDAAEKLQYDLYYVKNHSLLLDIVVMFETIGVVVMRKGAQ